MPARRILILGGTGLARAAAEALVQQGVATLTSLAGVTAEPRLPKGEIRKGGFGGVAGLVAFLRANPFDAVVDATHAFAAQMSAHAAQACAALSVPLLRLEAPAWVQAAGDHWQMVPDVAAAAAALPQGARVAVTVGRKEIGLFFARADLSGVARMIEPSGLAPPPGWDVLLERPPFSLASEIDLLRANGIGVLVSKNAGGPRAAKLDAAAALSLPVIMVGRPPKPAVTTVGSVADLLGSLGLRG